MLEYIPFISEKKETYMYYFLSMDCRINHWCISFQFFCIRNWDETVETEPLIIFTFLWCTSLFPTFISWLTEDSGKSTAKKDMWRPCGRLLLTLSSNLLLQKFSVYLKSQVCVLKLLEWMFWSIKKNKDSLFKLFEIAFISLME